MTRSSKATVMCVLGVAAGAWGIIRIATGQASSGGPALELRRTLAIPWVRAEAGYTAFLSNADPGSRWEIVVALKQNETEQVLGRKTVAVGADGTALVPVSTVFRKPGWYRVEARAVSADGLSLRSSIDVPVTARRVDFAWYQAEAGHELRWPTIQLSCPENQAEYWKNRGVIAARWCGAACGADKPIEHFIRGWSSHEAIAIDEFGGPPEHCEKFYKALVEARKLNPTGFIAVWFMGGYDYWPKLRDIVDLFLPEIYLNYLGFNLSRFDPHIRLARSTGCFDKTLPGLGINVVTDGKGNVRWRPTPEQVIAQIRYLKQIAPDLRGLAFFSYSSAEPEVRKAADQACEDYFLRPVADLVELRIAPERGRPGQAATATFILRNAGGMPARGLQVWLSGAGKKQVVWKGDIDAGAERELSFSWRPPSGWREVSVSIAPAGGTTLLRGEARGVVARIATDAPLALSARETTGQSLTRVPVFLPLPGRHPPATAARPLGQDGSASAMFVPVQIVEGPDGSRAVWLDPLPVGGKRLWMLSQTAPTPDLFTLERQGPVFIVKAGEAAFTLDASQDALTSVSAGGREILGSPWRMNWDAWRGFAEPRVEVGPLGVVITVPVSNEVIEGYSRYAFFGGLVEITRWFRPKADKIEVQNAGEGC
ncbi:MAG: hypothetical protein H5T86_13160, partial [Armatimonadetes bacterium]|nr:hypothetical protein [Armatimonadota bacterium]